jgi:predicted restriction endonuclease
MPNLGRRRQKTREEIDAARGREPNVNERFSRVPRKIWEAKNSSVREFLKQQYQGRCQICQETFSQRDGQPYFEGVYLVSRTRARWVDRYGNVLCLCANCSAKFLHGELIATSLLQQIDAFRPLEEGGTAEPAFTLFSAVNPRLSVSPSAIF